MNENGISLSGSLENWNSHTIATTNTVSGKPVHYYTNATGFTVPYGAGQVILANCTEIAVENQNCSNGSIGIAVGYSSNITLANNTCSGNTNDGIRLWSSSASTLTNNTCSSSGYYGIYLWTSTNCTIENTICDNNLYGVFFVSSSDCTIENTTCVNNGNGIRLLSSYGNTIMHSTCSWSGYSGIRFMGSSDTTITNTTISGNVVGIYLTSPSPGNEAHYNSINNNTEYGISATNNGGVTINAAYNWWGNHSGPYHPSKNPSGKGDNITNYVLFTPFFSTTQLLSIYPNPALDEQNIHFMYWRTSLRTIDRYVWRSSIDDEFYNGTEPIFSNSSLSLGNHTIYFKVRNSTGDWSDEMSTNLVVHERPLCSITSLSPNPAPEGIAVRFNGTATDDGTIERYRWSSDLDGRLHDNSIANFTSSDLSVGTHNITFRVRDNYGIWGGVVNTTLIVHERPRANITSISPDPALDTDTILFNATATDDGAIERYVWNSDLDGELFNGTQANFTSSELSVGRHNISFQVRDNYGSWSETVNITLTVHGRPTAIITSVLPDPAREGESVHFKGNGTDDGNLVNYTWRSSIDGTLYNGTSPAFHNATLANGTHTIYLKVEDEHDVWSEEVSTILRVNGLPRARIDEIAPGSGNEGEAIHFSGNVTDDGTIKEYAWHSSIDGLLSDEKTFSVSNLSNSTHVISFKARDDLDAWSQEVFTTLTINGVPRAKIDEIRPSPATPGTPVRFYGNGTDDGTIAGYEWRSDRDGWLGGVSSFSLSNLSQGTHTISFRVKDDVGIWSQAVEAQLAIEGAEISRAKKRLNFTSGETEVVEIPGTNVTLEITTTADLFNERVDVEETTNSTAFDIDPLIQVRYVNILVSVNISDALAGALIKVYYSEDMIPDGVNESSLLLFIWNETNRGWEPIAVCGINIEENYVWARVSHFSIYGIGEFNFPPVADAGKRQRARAGREMEFTGTGTDHFNRNIIVRYEWDFDGDGVYEWSSTTMNVTTHSYDSPGTYYAKLRVTDDGGGKGFDTVEIVVEEEDDDDSSGLAVVMVLFCVIALVSVVLVLERSGKTNFLLSRFGKGKGGFGLVLLVVLAVLMNVVILLPCEARGAPGDGISCDTTIIDISSSNYRPTEGEEVVISAKVHNTGTNDTYTTVWFGYFGNFSAIGEDHTFTEPDEIDSAQINFDTSDMEGEKTIFVIIKNSEPAESNLSNNVGAATITLDIQPAEEETNFSFWVLVIIGIVGVGGGGSFLYLKKQKERLAFQMKDVFLVYNDGRLILHEATRLRPDFDAEIMSGMLTAVQGFVTDSFRKDEEEGKLKKLQYEDLHILIENGDYVYCCVSLSTSGEIPRRIRNWLKEAIARIEDEFHDVLENWDGDSDSLRGTKRIIKETIILREGE